MSRRRRARLAATALAAVALVGCSAAAHGPDGAPPVEQDDLQREPQPDGGLLPAAAGEDLWLPYQVDQLALVTPPWPVAAAEQLGGVFLAPEEMDGFLEFRAVGAEGTVLWSVQRPAGCSGFVLTTTDDGRDVAVLADLDHSSGTLATTVSAYDLHTGEPVWGPVPAPGPHRGPGLVFAAMPDLFGEPEGAVALDAGTGAELDVPARARVVGEYAGTLLVIDDTHLTALAAGSGDEEEVRWQVPLSERGWSSDAVAAAAGTAPGPGVALLDVGADGAALVDLADGAVLADGVQDARTDAATGTRVLLDGTGVHGLDADGSAIWSAPAGPGAELRAVGGALVYLIDDGSVRVHNTLTGEVATGYDRSGAGRVAIPELFAPNGAVLLAAENTEVLATTRPGERIVEGARPGTDQDS